MKILKPGKVPDKRKKFICKTCKCIFECDKYKYEYEYECHYDLKDGGSVKEPTIDVCNKCKKSSTCRMTFVVFMNAVNIIFAEDAIMEYI